MDNIKKFVEYYDELFPLTDEQKVFLKSLQRNSTGPTRFLHVGCGTGTHAQYLAEIGSDVTGIDQHQDFVESASLRKKTQLQSVRYFYLPPIDMARFLGKGFYEVILSLNNQIIFMHDETLIKKMFYDAHTLLKQGGKFVLNLTNFSKYSISDDGVDLPLKESIRSKLKTSAKQASNGSYVLSQKLETSSGKYLNIFDNTEIYPLTVTEICHIAKNSGFSSVKFYENYTLAPWQNNSQDVLAVMEC